MKHEFKYCMQLTFRVDVCREYKLVGPQFTLDRKNIIRKSFWAAFLIKNLLVAFLISLGEFVILGLRIAW